MERIYVDRWRVFHTLDCIQREFEQEGFTRNMRVLETVKGRLKAVPPAKMEEIKQSSFSTDKFKHLELMAGSSRIGMDKWRCGHCRELVDKKDRFCRHCGFAFEDEIDLDRLEG